MTDLPIESFTGPFRFLSNFYMCEIIHEGRFYPSVEHAYQAAKTNDPGAKAAIRFSASPGRAKYEGKKVILRPDWEQVKQDIMLTVQNSSTLLSKNWINSNTRFSPL
jgi:predicted NAD-dependent protein-ADP-ribosyltransferase YbiA (DUF1768 family)